MGPSNRSSGLQCVGYDPFMVPIHSCVLIRAVGGPQPEPLHTYSHTLTLTHWWPRTEAEVHTLPFSLPQGEREVEVGLVGGGHSEGKG